MRGKITLTIIKPDAMANGHAGSILKMITENGFHLAAMKMISLNTSMAEQFYAIHKGKDFFEDLIRFMTSGPVVVAILQKENAVEDYRKFIGATDPMKAEEGTVRKLFAESVQRNAVHGSDSDENAIIESDFFFQGNERYYKE